MEGCLQSSLGSDSENRKERLAMLFSWKSQKKRHDPELAEAWRQIHELEALVGGPLAAPTVVRQDVVRMHTEMRDMGLKEAAERTEELRRLVEDEWPRR